MAKYIPETNHHGTDWGYQKGCRQECCKKAHRERTAQQRAQRLEFAKKHPEWIPHGDNGYKNWGCKCEICTTAHRESMIEYRARKKPRKLEQEREKDQENGS